MEEGLNRGWEPLEKHLILTVHGLTFGWVGGGEVVVRIFAFQGKCWEG